jgi:hypothetical protein
LLVWYTEIRARQSRGQYFEPLSLLEIEAYERRLAKSDLEMTAFDHDMICQLDRIWQDVQPELGK